jgi:hypothetical protein
MLALVAALLPALGAAAQQGQARLRVVHASPDAPSVDVWVNGSVAISDLAFSEATDYVMLAPGEYQIQVTATGGAAADAVIDATVTLEAGTDYTVAAVGQLASIEPLVLIDDNSAPAAGKAHLRVVHTSPDAPAVDVAVDGGPILISNLAFKSAADYLPVDAGVYDLVVRPTGSDTTVLEISGFKADAGTVYTVFAVGLAGDSTLSVLALVDSAAAADPQTTAPAMPQTGAGGTATDVSRATAPRIGLAIGLVLMLAAAGLVLARRQFASAR